MKECDKLKSHTSSKLHMIFISSNNVRHPVTNTFTPRHYTCRHFTSYHLNFTQLHFTPRHYTCRHFTSYHLNFTQLHFTTLSFGLTPLKFPTAPFHLTSLQFSNCILHHCIMYDPNVFIPVHILCDE